MKKREMDVTQTFYLDRTEEAGAIGIIAAEGTEIIPAGATLYAMPVGEKNAEYQRIADEQEVHFIFEDHLPEIDFYTVPQVDLFAQDRAGNFFGTVGGTSELTSDQPICYIKRDLSCWLLFERGADFLENMADWRNRLKPYQGVHFYSSKQEAEKDLSFIHLSSVRDPEE